MNGYNGFLLYNILSIYDFENYFESANKDIWGGMRPYLYMIGSIVATPFVGPLLDGWAGE